MAELPAWPGRGVAGKWPGPLANWARSTPSTIVKSTSILGMRMTPSASPFLGAAMGAAVGGGPGGVVVAVVAVVVAPRGGGAVDGGAVVTVVGGPVAGGFAARAALR